MSDIKDFFAEISALVNAELDHLIPAEGEGPPALREAVRWSLFGGGKHFRPALLFAVGRTFGAADADLIRTAAAIEMIHTYSLIHDDLPSMDDDNLRRGRATCHVQFGEATAILAGDALQALSFQAIADDDRLEDGIKIKLIHGLARAAARMVAGQQWDLEGERKDLGISDVEEIHHNKTGALITFSARAGATIAKVDDETYSKVSLFGSKLGLLFQITDDLLDVTGSTNDLGKTAGKDTAAGKATYPAVMGLDSADSYAKALHLEIEESLAEFTTNTDLLRSLAGFLVSRES